MGQFPLFVELVATLTHVSLPATCSRELNSLTHTLATCALIVTVLLVFPLLTFLPRC